MWWMRYSARRFVLCWCAMSKMPLSWPISMVVSPVRPGYAWQPWVRARSTSCSARLMHQQPLRPHGLHPGADVAHQRCQLQRAEDPDTQWRPGRFCSPCCTHDASTRFLLAGALGWIRHILVLGNPPISASPIKSIKLLSIRRAGCRGYALWLFGLNPSTPTGYCLD